MRQRFVRAALVVSVALAAGSAWSCKSGSKPTGRPPTALATAIANLSHEDANVRQLAAQQLGRIGRPEALDPLLKALAGDEAAQVRMAAARALGELGDPAAEPALRKAAGDRDPVVARAAKEALAKIGSPTPPVVGSRPVVVAADDVLGRLTEQLKTGTPQERLDAADGLGRLKDQRVVDPLIAALADNDPLVRQAAAMALGRLDWRLDRQRAVPELIKLLADSDRELRLAGARALGNIADARALDALRGLLQDGDGEVQAAAAEAAAQIEAAAKSPDRPIGGASSP